MKHWYRRLPFKIICFILCLITLATAVLSVIGAVIMIGEDVYSSTKEQFLYNETHYDIENSANTLSYIAVSGELKQMLDDYYTAEKTNLRYKVVKNGSELLLTNVKDNDFSAYDGKWTYEFAYKIVPDYDSFDIEPLNGISGEPDYDYCKAYVCIDESLPVIDDYALLYTVTDIIYALKYWIYAIIIVSLALTITFFILLMCASGRRANSDEVHCGLLNIVPFDVLAVGTFFLSLLGIEIIDESYRLTDSFEVALAVLLCIVGAALVLGLLMSIAARLKEKTLFTNTVIYKCGVLLWKLLKLVYKYLKRIAKQFKELILSIPTIWRTVAFVTLVVVVDFIALLLVLDNEEEAAMLLWFPNMGALVFVTVFAAMYMRKLQKGGEALAKGDLGYKVDTENMLFDFKQHGENLNRISDGMAIAVEERLQSERMKAELITNVSHDIKTPLTSIINYGGLIAEEECNCEKHKEYSEVLVRKSEHLKRLLEDLVEISKASTGNLDVILTPCDANVLLNQASGEFISRCEAASLELITQTPEKSVRIMADSRRIWRVFENLMSNACKYSLPNSRVYLSLEEVGDEARFVFRNTSREALNISASELTERFVRGDSSRSTEGNGLGLSIAKSLTELQNGRMDISIDGDLFKVTLSFKTLN